MVNPVANDPQVHNTGVVQSRNVPSNRSAANPPTTPQQASDTVTISAAGQTALQEATETHVQTVKESNAGDRQAKALLAREAAAQAPSAKPQRG